VPRTRLALLAVAGFVALAGCGAVLPGGDAAPSGPSADLEPAEPPYSTPLEDSDLPADHEAALRDAGDVTVVRNTTVSDSGSGGGFASLATARVSLANGRVFLIERPAPIAQSYRYANGTVYRQVANEDSYSHSRVENDSDGRTATEWARAPLERLLPLASFTHRGVTERDGGRVHVYRATDVEDVNASRLTSASSMESDLTAVNATVRVRESGVVERVTFAYTVEEGGETRRVSTAVTFSDVGETDVSTPVWVEDLHERFDDGRNSSG
jgi:hypothetical protein